MKSVLVHLMNKFFGCVVVPSKGSISVFGDDGELLIHLRKEHNVIMDRGIEYGAKYALDMSEIPREACAWKCTPENTIEKHSKFEERKTIALAMVEKYGYVPAIVELNKEDGVDFKHR